MTEIILFIIVVYLIIGAFVANTIFKIEPDEDFDNELMERVIKAGVIALWPLVILDRDE